MITYTNRQVCKFARNCIISWQIWNNNLLKHRIVTYLTQIWWYLKKPSSHHSLHYSRYEMQTESCCHQNKPTHVYTYLNVCDIFIRMNLYLCYDINLKFREEIIKPDTYKTNSLPYFLCECFLPVLCSKNN